MEDHSDIIHLSSNMCSNYQEIIDDPVFGPLLSEESPRPEQLTSEYEILSEKNDVKVHFNVDRPFDDLKYQIASDNNVHSPRPTVISKKIGKDRKRDQEIQEASKPKRKDRSARGDLLIPKNLYELCVGHTVTNIKKAISKMPEICALIEVINCIGVETITGESESILESLSNFTRADIKAFMSSMSSQDENNSQRIKDVFSLTFTPDSVLLQNYLLKAKRMKPRNREALQNPLILEKLRAKIEKDLS